MTNMTPKEKAKELTKKFIPFCGGYWGGKINKIFAKQCGLIAVDEILNAHLFNLDEKEYWQQVKEEIENL